ncbi:uncharacterized protein LOC135845318 [Planococcus citri]|uniref:uncharacterized protein LOC135845318 n=1 Tax=Planococcus citri TaxID=170843 RepID=UPI0031F87CEE
MIINGGYEIMRCFAEEPNYIEYTILTWKRVVNLIDDDNLNFILNYVTDMQKNRDYVNGLLREMWLCMSEQQKKFVANQQEFDYVAKWFERCEYNSPNYQLIFEVFLLWGSERERQHYWKTNWTDLVIGQMNNINKVEEIMKIILGSYENIAVFKRTVMIDYKSIGTACENLLSQGLFEELQKYLNYCTEDQNVIRNLKKQIIMTMWKDRLFHVLCDCCANEALHAEFEYFLRDVLTVDEIKDFQRDVLMASSKKSEKMLRDGFVHELIQCIEKYASSEKDLYTIKLHFMKYSHLLVLLDDVEIKIKQADWVHFLSWCLNGDKSLTERFKFSLQPAKASKDVEMGQYSLYEAFCDYFLNN